MSCVWKWIMGNFCFDGPTSWSRKRSSRAMRLGLWQQSYPLFNHLLTARSIIYPTWRLNGESGGGHLWCLIQLTYWSICRSGWPTDLIGCALFLISWVYLRKQLTSAILLDCSVRSGFELLWFIPVTRALFSVYAPDAKSRIIAIYMTAYFYRSMWFRTWHLCMESWCFKANLLGCVARLCLYAI